MYGMKPTDAMGCPSGTTCMLWPLSEHARPVRL